MFSNFFLKSFRILLLPFALLYWMVIAVRNFLYNKNIFKTTRFALPLICVGNLSVGGTGKSPMVEYLLRLLKDRYAVATLSRGYKRKTRGYALAGASSTALEIGDEPMQFHVKFPDVAVAVGEERIVAIPQLLHDRPDTNVIILDDAFQHRAITAGFNVLLTDYNNLFTRDFYLPTGDLRDLKSSAKRAQCIVVTKCPATVTDADRVQVKTELDPADRLPVFFTSIEYGEITTLGGQPPIQLHSDLEVLLVTGIANPKPLQQMLEERCRDFHLQQYPDHHIFTIDDLKDIRRKFDTIDAPAKIILTTEKDAVRLVKFRSEMHNLPIHVIPVRHHFLFNEGQTFDNLILNFITGAHKPDKL